MRVTRLINLVLLLQNRGSLTAPELASELGVSPRTIARDVMALGEAGIPIYARQGREGGYQLLGGFRTQLTGLSNAEVEALFLSGAPEALRGMGLDDAASTARLKVAAAISPAARQAPLRVQQRFYLDAPGWFRRAATPDQLAELSAAVWHDQKVTATYIVGQRLGEQRRFTPRQRELEPYGLVLKAGVWYLVARIDAQFRTYRVDRFDDIVLTTRGFERDHEFDLEEYWHRSAGEFAFSRLTEEITIQVTPKGLDRMEALLDPHTVATAMASISTVEFDSWVEVTLPVESLEVAFDEMTMLGAEVEVRSPVALRARLADAAQTLHERYRAQ